MAGLRSPSIGVGIVQCRRALRTEELQEDTVELFRVADVAPMMCARYHTELAVWDGGVSSRAR